MKNYVLLNNIEHKDLKVKTGYSASYGDNVASVLTFPTEFGDVHKEYPILFQKNPETGKFQSIVLLGFKKGENLFLNESGWNARYVPGIVARGPFLIGFQDQTREGGGEREPVIHVDMSSPRISQTDGEPLFQEFGGITPYLKNISVILQGIHAGMSIAESMFSLFEQLELIEPITIKVELNNGEKYSIEGNYTISQDRLAQLSGDALFTLNQSGFLQGAFLVLSSLRNVNNLINMKNLSLKA